MGRGWSEAASGQVGRLLLRCAPGSGAGRGSCGLRPPLCDAGLYHPQPGRGGQFGPAGPDGGGPGRGRPVGIRGHHPLPRREPGDLPTIGGTGRGHPGRHLPQCQADPPHRGPGGGAGKAAGDYRRSRPPGGGGHRRMVQPSGGPLGRGGLGEVAGGTAGAAGPSPHICLSNHLHTKNLE